jgi:uncharacterized OB-fold protein
LTDDREFNSSSFYKFLAEKKLMASKCKRCGSLYVPPHPICTKCHGREMEWAEMEGSGKVAAFTAISVGPSPTIEEGYGRNNPYVVGVVQLDEGPRISGRIQGLNAREPEGIRVGTPVAVEFLEPEDGKKCYVAFKAR